MKDNYKIEESKSKPNHWVCSDFENKIVCVFENKKYNETQMFTFLEDFNPNNFMQIAKITRKMGNWLFENHRNKIS